MSANICANRVFIYELLPPAPPPKAIINFGTVKVKPQIVNWIIFLLLSFFSLLICSSLPHAPSGFIATSFLIWFRHCFIWIWPFFSEDEFQCGVSFALLFSVLLSASFLICYYFILCIFTTAKRKNTNTHKKRHFPFNHQFFLMGYFSNLTLDPWLFRLIIQWLCQSHFW